MVIEKIIKSPLNYTGGKYKLLPQLMKYFPSEYDTFIDLFTGGSNISVNMKAKKIFAYDTNEHVINLFNYFKKHTYDEIVEVIEKIIEYYNLSNSTLNGYRYYKCESSKGLGSYNKEKYIKLREDYNFNKNHFPNEMFFFTLVIFGFNNQIRFNQKGFFNMPVGKRDFNKNIRNNLKLFMESIKEKEIVYEIKDFRKLEFDKLKENDFVYADPPYLITTATYNEQEGWTEKDEKDLLNLLDEIHKRKIKFALSNVLQKGKIKNEHLDIWSKAYNVHIMDFNYKNSNYQKREKEIEEVEVLITNY